MLGLGVRLSPTQHTFHAALRCIGIGIGIAERACRVKDRAAYRGQATKHQLAGEILEGSFIPGDGCVDAGKQGLAFYTQWDIRIAPFLTCKQTAGLSMVLLDVRAYTLSQEGLFTVTPVGQ
jgi:hypothetical protein